MLEKAIAIAKERRVASVLLHVATFRLAAIGLYTKHGFIKDQLLLNYYTPMGGDAFSMRLDIIHSSFSNGHSHNDNHGHNPNPIRIPS